MTLNKAGSKHFNRTILATATGLVILLGLGLWGLPMGENAARHAQAAEKAMTTNKNALATFAGGCFWCMEHPFDELDGVLSTTSGYIGGHLDDPTYKDVSSGTSGHAEAMQVEFDPARVSYETLLEVFWRNVDPLDTGGQFCDRGGQYRSSIFYHDEEQMELAAASKAALDESGRLPQPIVTPIVPATTFYPAEAYHQDYYRRNPVRYRFYRYGCGRDKRLEELWGAEAGGGHLKK